MKALIVFAGVLTSLLLLSLVSFTQEIKGLVTDSTGSLLPYVTVSVKSKTSGIIISYATTDSKGRYVLQVDSSSVLVGFVVEARCVGYNSQSKTLTSLPATVDFSLSVSARELTGVVVRSRVALRTRGDTSSYRVADFSSPQDRVIGDVIKKLPGISIATDGTISYNNRPISGVYLGGDNLLDDRYNIATGTIPQGVVDQVQVIDNHQPVRVLQNKVLSNDVILNLAFKKSARLHLLGQESLGIGESGHYFADLNALLFKDRVKAVNSVKANNTGEDLQRELVSHTTEGSLQRTGIDPSALLSLGSVTNPDLARQRYFFNHSALININNLANLGNETQLRVNAWYLHDKQRQDYSQRTTVFLPGDTILYNEGQHNLFNPRVFHARLTFTENREKYYLNDILNFDDNPSINYSDLTTNATPVNQEFRDRPVSFFNEFNLIKTFGLNKIIEGYSYISRFTETERLGLGPDYRRELFNRDMPYAQLTQAADVPTWFTNNYISYKIQKNSFTESLKTGFSIQSQTLNSGLTALQSNNSTNRVSDSAFNHTGWTNKKFYTEVAFDMPTRKLKFNLTLPLLLQQLEYNDTGYALNVKLSRIYCNPQLVLKYQTGIENYVTLQYYFRNETGTIESVYRGSILRDYRTLSENIAGPGLQENQMASAGFTHRRALKLFFFNINLAWDYNRADNIIASALSNNFQKQAVVPLRNSTGSWLASSSISKYSFALHSTFSAAVQWQDIHSVQLQNNTFLPFNTLTTRVTAGVDTKVNKQINFNYHITGTQTRSRSPAEIHADRIDQIMQQAALYYYPSSKLLFKLSGEHYFTSKRFQRDLNYFFVDGSVKYHFKKWNTDVQLDAGNLLNVKTYNAFYLSANTLTNSSYILPGRIVLVKFLFNI